MNPQFPIFIPTKGRADSRLTIKMFDRLEIPYTIFIEKNDLENYIPYVKQDYIHVLPHENRGLTVTRNYIWDYAQDLGLKWFWTFDDNIQGLYRYNHNLKTPCADGTIIAVIEDFVQRYENIAIAGMNYFMFVKRKYIIPPYILNTRIYSNMLIRTHARDQHGHYFRNKTFFNDDTDLCLRVLKHNWCTVLFNAFLIEKQTTMQMSGGMTDYYKQTHNRLEFCQELQDAHPDCVKITKKWGRYQHQVDYSRFTQQLKRRDNMTIPERINNFGMVLQERYRDRWRELPD